MNRIFFLSITLLFSASCASAQELYYKSTAGTVEFRAIGHPSALHVVGKGSGPEGKLLVKKSQITGTVTFDLNTLDTGIALRDEHMKNKYLELAKYPRAALTLSQLILPQPLVASFTTVTAVPFKGILKFHGVEKPVSGTLSLERVSGSQLQTVANFNLMLTDFGIEIPKFMGITIAEDVQVSVKAVAETQGQPE